MRPLCPCCQKSPRAINYYKDKKVFYRKFCESCAKNGGKDKGTPRWYQLGYRKKDFCEKCGFKSKHSEQFNVLFVDGDLNNCRPVNLKTVCANCQRILQKEGVKWRQGDLLPDF
jgi:prepilin-type processing-associated H-X9-DG protein